MRNSEAPAINRTRTPRPLIAASWLRSYASGVPQAAEFELPYSDDFDRENRLSRAAQPVLERLIDSMSGTRHSMVLADVDGRIVNRWVAQRALNDKLDNARIAPGFEFAEEFAGTNGVGTALEERKAVIVHGTEHFADFLHRFSCVGIPILHPTRGTIEGVLDFTCLATDFHPLMTPLLVEATKHIETRFAQEASASESALLEAFVRMRRRTRAPLVAMRTNFLLTNSAAAGILNGLDQAVLWEVASGLVAGGHDVGTVELSTGRYGIRISPVDGGDHGALGLVVRFSPIPSAQPVPIPALTANESAPASAGSSPPGRSAQWVHVLDRVPALIRSGQPIAVCGESGTGKHRFAAHLHAQAGHESVREFDAAVDGREGPGRLVERCRAALERGDGVIIRHLQLLAPESLDELAALARRVSRPAQLIVTVHEDATDAVTRTIGAFPQQVWLPPLRQRSEDIAEIVPALLADLSSQRPAVCSSAALQALMRYEWPGNITELRDVLGVALGAAPRGVIEPAHLPHLILRRAQGRKLTPMEYSERDLIVKTLAVVDGNRTEAARVLGIGRATLYRKLRSLGISAGADLAD
ncbi:sigma-54-dependent Fis family transcriptional regulator [Agromyces bauzanensis]|uniref:Fis family transcriptional regulator n=1 Tax=Agromyces bauzanensis TaxID=1308924 RepID=A0A917PCI3_9MICO|nr:helix-turn-helix domain-containing protein [Agromyces bauzanensis]GGJ70849.1 Fis family transcriptional regulator [Agromyces bauzanensis]